MQAMTDQHRQHSAAQTPPIEEQPHTSRRTFLEQGAFAAGSLALGLHVNKRRPPRHDPKRRRPPNILVIVVDQMRTPVWMPAAAPQASVTPHIWGLRDASVSFESHYTASNDCSPSRAVLLTGLYTHQTGVMITGDSWLDPRFPTWGTLLRQMGYSTAYYGKWHLHPNAYASLEQYGFDGGTYPSPNGSPGQGTQVDPLIAGQFKEWLKEDAGREPWCTTVSFVNPHDIAWWWRYTAGIPAEASPPQYATALPPNFETPQQMIERGKPALQRSLQDTANQSFGTVPFEGPEALPMWTGLMNTYLQLQSYVDAQVGAVLGALRGHPKMASNTVVVFTSDHGEYGGSHGMRGKGASAYEEAIRVPLYVHDPRGVVAKAVSTPRLGLTSSADVVPLLLSIASGSSHWRSEPSLSHLAGRHDVAAMCEQPSAAGRDWVLHATDEDVTEFASHPYAADAPRHVVAIRTPQAKLGVYSNWRAGTTEAESAGEQIEVYDYSTATGQMELESVAGRSPLQEQLLNLLYQQALPDELHQPLPSRLRLAQREGLANYQAVEAYSAEKLTAAYPNREREAQQEGEGL
jgi:arylsulfatase A-like enzyme